MSHQSSEFNDHGFGIGALEAIAAALYKDVGGCGNDEPGESCEDAHFYPHAESALRGLACVYQVADLRPYRPLDGDLLVARLRECTRGTDYGDMCQLAFVVELLRDEELERFKDVWEYLVAEKHFKQEFVDRVAKTFWLSACRVVSETPYRHAIAAKGLVAQRRLTAYLLREVCATWEATS